MLKPILSPFAAQMRICERAHAGIVRARAEHFHEGDRRYRNHNIPEEFWWAEGHESLKQDWSAGDFSTWIQRRIKLKAFGVTFARADIEKILPAPRIVKEETPAAQSSTKQKRKLTTIVSLDVAGYSADTQVDEPRMTAAIVALRDLIKAIAARHDGGIFNTAGDGFMLEFSSSVAAVEAAIELADKCEPSVRVGVHLGDVVVQENGDLLGHGVNVAARLMAQAGPGSVLVSADVHRTIHAPLAQSFRSLGMRKLDKMSETIEVFALVRDQSPIVPPEAARITLREAATRMYEALRGTKLGRWYEGLTPNSEGTRDPEKILDNFAGFFVHYADFMVKCPPSRVSEPFAKAFVGKVDVRNGARDLHFHGDKAATFTDIDMTEAEAEKVIAEIKAKADEWSGGR